MGQERVAIVTGGNRGIGYEVCRRLLAEDLIVVLAARDEAKGHAAAKKLGAPVARLRVLALDQDDPRSVKKFGDQVKSELGRADILVNNAGIYIGERPMESIDLGPLEQSMRTNLYGPLLVSQAILPLMHSRNYGRIINVSSDMAAFGNITAGYGPYRVSKAALNALTKVMAAELAGTNILVNVMSPGWVRTDMGGPTAPRSVEEGADTIVWLAMLPDGGPSGGFFRDRQPCPW